MKAQAKQAQYTGGAFVRMDEDTINALAQLAKLTQRSKSDAMRWSVRQMAATLTADKKLSAMKSKET